MHVGEADSYLPDEVGYIFLAHASLFGEHGIQFLPSEHLHDEDEPIAFLVHLVELDYAAVIECRKYVYLVKDHGLS